MADSEPVGEKRVYRDRITGEFLTEVYEDRSVCQYYARCTNKAIGLYQHPIIGPVPICQRCADEYNIDIAKVN